MARAKTEQAPEDELLEAASATTAAARLRALMRKSDDLARAVAGNPSADLKLLDGLTHRFPNEVLTNPGLVMQQLNPPGPWGRFCLRSLVALYCASPNTSEPGLVAALKKSLTKALAEASSYVDVTNREIWIFQTRLRPAEIDGLTHIDPALDLKVQLVQRMTGTGQFELDIPPFEQARAGGDCPIKDVLAIIADGNLDGLITEPYIEDPHVMSYRDIEMDEADQEETLVEVLAPEGYSACGNQIRNARRKTLFAVEAGYNNPDEPYVDEQTLYLGVGDDESEVRPAPPTFDSSQLGALGELWNWSPPVLAPEFVADWIGGMVNRFLALET